MTAEKLEKNLGLLLGPKNIKMCKIPPKNYLKMCKIKRNSLYFCVKIP